MDPTSARRQFLKFLSGSPLLAIPGFAAWAAQTPSRFPDPIIWAPFNSQDCLSTSQIDPDPDMRPTITRRNWQYD
jgi:hypothetical protein